MKIVFNKIVSALLAVAVVLSFSGPLANAESSAASGTPDAASQAPSNSQEAEKIVYELPKEMKAFYIKPGEDFAVNAEEKESSTYAKIDKIIATAVDYDFNTIVVSLNNNNGVIYNSALLRNINSVDSLGYLVTKAHEKKLFVYAVFDPLFQENTQGFARVPYINSSARLAAGNNLTEIMRQYDVDALLIEDFSNSVTPESMAAYKAEGSGMGFDNWLRESTVALAGALSNVVHTTRPRTMFGFVAETMWTNGTKVPDSAEKYAAGHIDLNTIMVVADVNLVMVKLPEATTSKTHPFQSTLTWWVANLKQYETNVAALVYNEKLGGSATGWKPPDQVLRQIAATRSVNGTLGAAFNSYASLVANKSDTTNLLLKYYRNEIKTSDILTDLTVSRPEKLTYTTYEPTVSFYGASDPNFPLLLNGKAVERNDKGVFSIAENLAAGVNKFVFTHKEKSVTYSITRNVLIISEVNPMGSLTVEGSTQLQITATAYPNSTLTANVNGTSIPLAVVNNETEATNKDSNYVTYTGVYNVPAATTSEQNLGNISVSGTWQGITQSKQGAVVRVAKLPIQIVDSGNMVQVTADQARTYPSTVLNSDPWGNAFALPAGTVDYIVSDMLTYTSANVTYNYYILNSGLRINAADVTSLGIVEQQMNAISTASSATDGQYFYLSLAQSIKRAYTVEFVPVSFNNNTGITSFGANQMKITFKDTTTVPPEALALAANNLFTGGSFEISGQNVILTLNMRRAGAFLGYKAFYDEAGNLVFRFNLIPAVGGSLNGVKIYVDPGHGGEDVGALPIAGMKTEKELNYEIGMLVVEKLRALGANVQFTDTLGRGYVGLDQRVVESKSFSPQLFVSIHHNSSTAPTAKGVEVWYFNMYSEIFADNISARVASALGTTDRGEKYGWYRVTAHQEFPAVLVEYGFLSNTSELAKIKDSAYQNAVADQTVAAILATFQNMQ